MMPSVSMTPASDVKPLLPIGCLMDIPTGYTWNTGLHGESILNGGLPYTLGIVGRGNLGKSALKDYIELTAADRIMSGTPTKIVDYDSENNIDKERKYQQSQRYDSFKGKDILSDGTWTITDVSNYYGDEFMVETRNFCLEKEKNAKSIMVDLPLRNRDGSVFKMLTPTIGCIDSFTEFMTCNIAAITDKTGVGDTERQTVHMRQGLAKANMLKDLPRLVERYKHYMVLTAHVGGEVVIASGPPGAQPPRKLQHLKQGDVIKGVTEKFFFLTLAVWQLTGSTIFTNQGTKAPEYPRDKTDNDTPSTDLNLINLKLLRNKCGPSGGTVNVFLSQQDGILPTLSEFHYVKNADRFGINGSIQNYHMDLCPDVGLSRTTVRGKIDNDPKLRRAINITSELRQMMEYQRHLAEWFCSPEELFKDLKALGYDWDQILATRGWHTVNNDKHPVPYLSTLDLLKMRKQKYKPYWM